MKLISWKSWALVFALIAVWTVLGIFYDTSPALVEWLGKIAEAGVPVAALTFTAIYTVLGFTGSAKWWRTNFGLRIVLFPLAIAASTIIAAWAVLFHHGMINTPIPAWIYIGGHFAAIILLAWGGWLWIRAASRNRHGNDGGNVRAE